ncbi:MAG: SDR family NAD(P)-dependent oxidoreductase, partial [Polyangiaceae bacterium]
MSGGPHVLVTGGGGAIGAALAHELARRDPTSRLTLVDVDQERVEAEARALGSRAIALTWDLAAPESLPVHVTALVRERGAVDVLVNCAGIMEIRSLAATDWALGARLLRVDLESPMRLMALIVPSMVERRRGTVVNVSSMAGVTPLRGCAYYGGAKAGLAMASEIARLELAPRGIHVVTVYPGPVRSNLERRARGQARSTVLARWLPTGEPPALARRVVDACERRRPRVVYPSFYDLASRFPGVARVVTSMASPA